ncbi:MAG TPA: UDP-glucose 4-epimerase, partial [Acinetobacter radioresistens]|nr:UDP-glucose 4-epimerase [Acinetobacter radioresistens]
NDNVSCIMSLLRSMQRTGVRSLVHLSSLAVYGKSGLDLTEDEPFNYTYPNPYVKSQQMVEEIIYDTYKTDNEWKIAILRLGNVAGAFEHGVLGEYVTPLPKNIMPMAMQAAAMQREYIELQRHANTEDQTVERSFLHVLDACDAIISSLLWLQNQYHCCEAFNIAGEKVVSIQALLDQVATHTQSDIRTIDATHKLDELEQLGANLNKAKIQLQWGPKRTLKQMIEDEWRFYQNTLQGQ